MRRIRGFLIYGIALPAIALLGSYRLIPRDAERNIWWESRYSRNDPVLRQALVKYRSLSDSARAYEEALARLDSRERARSAASHRSGLLVRADSGVSAATEASARRIALEELAAIGAAEPRHPIAVIVMTDTRSIYPPYERAVVLPADPGAPCTVVLRISYRHSRFASIGNADRLLGTCGFYAAHGAPGEGMRTWLTETGLVAAAYLQRPLSHGDGIVRDPAEANAAGSGVDMAACRAGRLDGCERLFTMPQDRLPEWFTSWRNVATGVPTAGVLMSQPMQFNAQRTGITAGLLASMAQDLGPERFRRVWSSAAPPLQAFEASEGRPLASWIEERVRTSVLMYHAGPGVGIAQWLSLALLLGAVMGLAWRFSQPSLAA